MKIIIGIVVGLIVIGSVVFFTKSNSSQEPAGENATTSSTQESTAQTDTNSTADTDTTATAEGEYKDYSAEAVSATGGLDYCSSMHLGAHSVERLMRALNRVASRQALLSLKSITTQTKL